MKFFALMAVTGWLASGPMAMAQYSPTPVAPPAASGDSAAAQAREARNANLQKVMANFSLTPEQKMQMSDALKKQSEKMKALRTDPTVTDENRAERQRAVIDEADETLRGIFTPEQFAKWMEATKDMKPPMVVKPKAAGTNAVAAPKKD